MAIPPDVRANAETALAEFCQQHSGQGDEGERFIYEVEESAVVLIQQRPSFMNPAERTSKPIARARYSEARGNWSLYWPDNNGRWQRVTNAKAEKDLRALLQAILDDPLGVFWS